MRGIQIWLYPTVLIEGAYCGDDTGPVDIRLQLRDLKKAKLWLQHRGFKQSKLLLRLQCPFSFGIQSKLRLRVGLVTSGFVPISGLQTGAVWVILED